MAEDTFDSVKTNFNKALPLKGEKVGKLIKLYEKMTDGKKVKNEKPMVFEGQTQELFDDKSLHETEKLNKISFNTESENYEMPEEVKKKLHDLIINEKGFKNSHIDGVENENLDSKKQSGISSEDQVKPNRLDIEKSFRLECRYIDDEVNIEFESFFRDELKAKHFEEEHIERIIGLYKAKFKEKASENDFKKFCNDKKIDNKKITLKGNELLKDYKSFKKETLHKLFQTISLSFEKGRRNQIENEQKELFDVKPKSDSKKPSDEEQKKLMEIENKLCADLYPMFSKMIYEKGFDEKEGKEIIENFMGDGNNMLHKDYERFVHKREFQSKEENLKAYYSFKKKIIMNRFSHLLEYLLLMEKLEMKNIKDNRRKAPVFEKSKIKSKEMLESAFSEANQKSGIPPEIQFEENNNCMDEKEVGRPLVENRAEKMKLKAKDATEDNLYKLWGDKKRIEHELKIPSEIQVKQNGNVQAKSSSHFLVAFSTPILKIQDVLKKSRPSRHMNKPKTNNMCTESDKSPNRKNGNVPPKVRGRI
ncbi:hypothetical protein V1387_18395 [Allomuricauda taeanensis]|uniref:hypothetical protein n=1 Tax=Flagellimonas taeanensis TaxID=1005926 RepID=UPI002E7BA35C|nr:hypothetical protein [Allomuricauda taeanensis]MEE1964655.1 hypothetical protein [Allomuricauda taeanensis]